MEEKEASKQVVKRWERKRGQALWREELLVLLLRKRWVTLSPIEPITNTSASGPMPSSFEKTDYCVSCCDSQSCILAQAVEHYLQSWRPTPDSDTWHLTHALLCLLLITSLSATLSSLLWLFNHETGQLYVKLQFFQAVFNFGQGFISIGIFGLDKHLAILPFKGRMHR